MATTKRRTEDQLIETYRVSLMNVAKIAMEDKPQLLESLGLLVCS